MRPWLRGVCGLAMIGAAVLSSSSAFAQYGASVSSPNGATAANPYLNPYFNPYMNPLVTGYPAVLPYMSAAQGWSIMSPSGGLRSSLGAGGLTGPAGASSVRKPTAGREAVPRRINIELDPDEVFLRPTLGPRASRYYLRNSGTGPGRRAARKTLSRYYH